MGDFWLYFKLGLEHVLDWQAYDHVLFIVALCVSYSFASWRKLLVLVTLFTLGHTISLFISGYGLNPLSARWVEFLIPVSIIAAALHNIFKKSGDASNEGRFVLFAVTLFFGLVHGLGFGRYFHQINDEQELLPLLEFALGIEAAQLIVVLGVLISGYLLGKIFPVKKKYAVIIVSAVIILLCLSMLYQNWPF